MKNVVDTINRCWLQSSLINQIIVKSLNDSAESWANAVLYEEGNYDVKGEKE